MKSVAVGVLFGAGVGCTAMPTEEVPTSTPTPPPQWSRFVPWLR